MMDWWLQTVQRNLRLKCVTWNVRTLNQARKFEIKQKMLRMKMDILGVSEVRWPGVNKLDTDEGCFIHLGGHTAERGVGIMLTKNISTRLIGYWAISD